MTNSMNQEKIAALASMLAWITEIAFGRWNFSSEWNFKQKLAWPLLSTQLLNLKGDILNEFSLEPHPFTSYVLNSWEILR